MLKQFRRPSLLDKHEAAEAKLRREEAEEVKKVEKVKVDKKVNKKK